MTHDMTHRTFYCLSPIARARGVPLFRNSVICVMRHRFMTHMTHFMRHLLIHPIGEKLLGDRATSQSASFLDPPSSG